MPTPNEGESQEQFLRRCMGDAEAMRTFPKQDQRFAFCHSQWARSRAAKKQLKTKDNVRLSKEGF